MVDKAKLRSNLLKMMKLETEVVMIGKNKVVVHELGADDYTQLWTDPKNEKVVGKHLIDGKEADKTEINMGRFTACLLVKVCKDENGETIFGEEDIEVIQNSKKDIFIKLADVARRLNGMGKPEKNSNAISSDSDSGESQLDLDLDTPTS